MQRGFQAGIMHFYLQDIHTYTGSMFEDLHKSLELSHKPCKL